ncbi:MAG: cobalt ECF transporter T component CbiQ [Coriobacteriia bacterium]|nr:cobalt ECF transporter T component CbiQ [Coriobacteriia bacterium]
MSAIESGMYQLGWLDQFSRGDTPLHRIDPRAKVLATFVFLVCVVSFDQYDLLALAPFALFPIALASQSGMPGRELWKRLAAVAPFAVLVGALNPFFDTEAVVQIGSVVISGGVLSWMTIIARFLLTTSVALILIATTGMAGVCAGLEKLGLPDVLSTQLLLLYRYLFVLAEEIMRMARARSLRSFGSKGMGPTVYASMLGHLLIRTVARAQRVYNAMSCRGFDGRVRTMRVLKMRRADWVFLAGWSAAFVVFRTVNISVLLGNLITGVLS